MADQLAQQNLQTVSPANHVRTETVPAASLASSRGGLNVGEDVWTDKTALLGQRACVDA